MPAMARGLVIALQFVTSLLFGAHETILFALHGLLIEALVGTGQKQIRVKVWFQAL